MPPRFLLQSWLCLVLFAGAIGMSIQGAVAEDQRPLRFNRDIRPILSDNCFQCHGPDADHRKADLRFDVEPSAKEDRGGYRAIVPGDPDDSELMLRITSDDPRYRMPPAAAHKQLDADEISLLGRWIKQGAPYEEHWSFVPPRRPAAPQLESDWPQGDIDRFILARLDEEGFEPSAQADPLTLVRRLSFDLTGLPPTPEMAESFAHDPSDARYEQLVDQLLDSPHFGERMAMYWLDLVRYADTVGYHGDQEHAISPYRDWVIHAFNQNMPFDQFTIEQLAGDLLPDASVNQKIASGYNRVLQTSHEGGVQVKEYLSKYDADRVRNVSNVWMGATMGCAECHDHKYDPFTQHDFFSLVAFFADVDDLQTFRGRDTSPTRREPELEVLSPIDRQIIEQLETQAAKLRQQLAELPAAEDADTARAKAARDVEQEQQLRDQLEALRREIEQRREATRRTMITSSVEPRTIRVLPRGDWMDDSGPVVEPAVPHSLPPLEANSDRATRLDLARWLTSPDHPMTSRVFVNRLWYLFFGVGLSKTLDDFGSQGEWPTHPELLDWLAVEFVESEWDVKHMVKLIVTSQAYRQSSLESASLRQLDPMNRLFARQSRFRLPAEMIRDQALAVSGLLVDRLGGPSIRPYQPEGYYQPLNFPRRTYEADQDENQYRRGVYIHWQRQYLHPMLAAFDAPSREECTAQRPISNTPLAALTLLNDPTFVEAARVFAARMVQQGGEDRIAWAFRQALTRPPDDYEREVLNQFYQQSRQRFAAQPEKAHQLLQVGMAPVPEQLDAVELAAWTAVARALLNLNETITRN